MCPPCHRTSPDVCNRPFPFPRCPIEWHLFDMAWCGPHHNHQTVASLVLPGWYISAANLFAAFGWACFSLSLDQVSGVSVRCLWMCAHCWCHVWLLIVLHYARIYRDTPIRLPHCDRNLSRFWFSPKELSFPFIDLGNIMPGRRTLSFICRGSPEAHWFGFDFLLVHPFSISCIARSPQ